MIFVCSATHKTKSMFFFLAQTEQGDIFKVTLETDEEMVRKIKRIIKSNCEVDFLLLQHIFHPEGQGAQNASHVGLTFTQSKTLAYQ